MRSALFLACALGLAAGGPARAAEPEPVPLSVTSVATGGYWTDQGRGGPVRAVVRTLGFESVASQLTVEWLAESTLPSQPGSVVAAVPLEHPLGTPGVFSVSVQALRPGCVQVRITGQPGAEGGPRARPISRQWWALQPGQLLPQRDDKGRLRPTPAGCRTGPR